jgi:hypothetical protein
MLVHIILPVDLLNIVWLVSRNQLHNKIHQKTVDKIAMTANLIFCMMPPFPFDIAEILNPWLKYESEISPKDHGGVKKR